MAPILLLPLGKEAKHQKKKDINFVYVHHTGRLETQQLIINLPSNIISHHFNFTLVIIRPFFEEGGNFYREYMYTQKRVSISDKENK